MYKFDTKLNFGISKDNFIVVSECTDLDDSTFISYLSNNKKLSINPNTVSANLVLWLHNSIPDYITHLVINTGFYSTHFSFINKLPKNLKLLSIISNKNKCYENEIDKLEKITKTRINNYSYFNENIDNLPEGLEYLYIASDLFNKPIDHLPIGLKSLCIESSNFDQNIDYLPINLENLIIDNDYSYFSKIIYLDNLPVGLKKLIIKSCNFACDKKNLPKGLEYIDLPNYKLNVNI